MHKTRSEYISFFALFAAVSVLLFFVLVPFFSSLALAAVAAALLHKPYETLSKFLRGQKTLAALLVACAVLLFFIIPIFYVGSAVFHEALMLYSGGAGNGGAYIHSISQTLARPIQHFYPAFSLNLNAYIGTTLSFVAANLAAFVSGAIAVLFQTFLMLLAFFFFLRDGKKLTASLMRVSPFGEEQTRDVLHTMYATVQSVIKGTLLVALIRWLCIGVAFYLLGVPNALLWGSLGGIVGAIPGIGTLAVFIPAIAYLYLQGSVGAAVAMAVVGIVAIVLIDNLLTPYFFGKDLAVPSIFILFSILGGIIYFGPAGFVLGPLVLVVFSSLLTTYPQVILDKQV